MSQDFGHRDFGNDILQERKRNPLVLVGESQPKEQSCIKSQDRFETL